jgi:type III secretory pathway component EscU
MENHQHLQTLRSIAFIVGVFLLVFSLTMVIPAITNKYLGYEWKNFLAGFVITCTSGAIFVLLGKLSRLHGMQVVFAIPAVLGLLYPYLQLFRSILIVWTMLMHYLKRYLALPQQEQLYSVMLKSYHQEYCCGEQCCMV